MKAWRGPIIAGLLVWLAIVVGVAVPALMLLVDVLGQLPRLPADPAELGVRPGTEIFAAGNERIYTFNQSRQWARLEGISPHAVDALLATEDARFYEHAGVDLKAILGAVWANLRAGYGTRGGSTLTQQLVKRLFFSPEKSLRRKLSEMLLAVQLERLYAQRYPGTTTADTLGRAAHPVYKDRLLELYLNTVFYGANAYGITDAAYTYFGATPDSLTLPQAALLMGLINAPTAYNPLQRPGRATERLHHVLTRMVQAGHLAAPLRARLDSLQADSLIDEHRTPRNPAPYWVEAIKAEVARRWGPEVLRYGSLRIHTTLDMAQQRAAEQAVAAGLTELDRLLGFSPYDQATMAERAGYVQAAMVCLAPQTGQVRAMVGGRDIFVSYYNRALTARRQPGSCFKPVAYLAAFDAGVVSPVSLFIDEKRHYWDHGRLWVPANFAESYMGLTTAAWALVRSANAVAVQVTDAVGPERVVQMARRLGFTSPIGAYPSIALGVSEVTVLEMASAYGTLVTAGLHMEPTLVDSVVDASGRRLFAHAPRIQRAVSPELAFQMLRLLELVVDRGTGRRVRATGYSGAAAGKTGTTNDNTDAWFTGVTPTLAASVWVGFDDRGEHRLVDTEGRQLTGGTAAAPMWAHFVAAAAPAAPAGFTRPVDVHLETVDPLTGVPASALPPPEADGTPRPAPIQVALQPLQSSNTPAQVLRYERDQGRPLLGSHLHRAWGQLQQATTQPR